MSNINMRKSTSQVVSLRIEIKKYFVNFKIKFMIKTIIYPIHLNDYDYLKLALMIY